MMILIWDCGYGKKSTRGEKSRLNICNHSSDFHTKLRTMLNPVLSITKTLRNNQDYNLNLFFKSPWLHISPFGDTYYLKRGFSTKNLHILKNKKYTHYYFW